MPLIACVMATVPANRLIAPITDWMPAFLRQEDWGKWIGEEDISPAEAKVLLKTVEGTHYITQIMLGLADNGRANSVPLRDDTRQSIQTYIYHLRQAILRANVAEGKKQDLLMKLEELETEIGRHRVRIAVVAGVVMSILSAPGELAGSYDAIARLTNSIMREIGQARDADQEQRHISFEQPVALIPPRPAKKEQQDELDDEIPFRCWRLRTATRIPACVTGKARLIRRRTERLCLRLHPLGWSTSGRRAPLITPSHHGNRSLEAGHPFALSFSHYTAGCRLLGCVPSYA